MRQKPQQPPRWTGASLVLSALLAACSPSPPPPGQGPAPSAPTAGARGDGPQISIGVTVGVPADPRGMATALPALPTARVAAPATPAGTTPAATRAETTFRFQEPLDASETIEEIATVLKRDPAILDVSGDEQTITVAYDPARHSPDRLREVLAGAQHPVEP